MSEQKSVAVYSSVKKIARMIVIVVIIGLLVNILISFFFGFQSLSAAVLKVSWEHILVPFAIYLLIYLIDSLRLKLVLRQFRYPIKLGDAYVNSLMGYFFSNLTPLATGGQPFQIYHLQKIGIDAKTSTNIIMSRFVEYLASAILITLIFIPSILPLLDAVSTQTTFLVIGFSVSVAASVLMVILFIRPDWIGNFLIRLEQSFLGKFITKISKKKNWGKAAHSWSRELRKNIAFLWKEKFYIIIIDVILGILILGLQVFSLTWILITLVGVKLNFLHVFVTVLLLNLVVYYIPSPGACGGLEGIYTMVFSIYTGLPQLSFIAVAVWRLATYYLQIVSGMFVFLFMRRRGGVFPNSEQEKHPKKDQLPGPAAD